MPLRLLNHDDRRSDTQVRRVEPRRTNGYLRFLRDSLNNERLLLNRLGLAELEERLNLTGLKRSTARQETSSFYQR